MLAEDLYEVRPLEREIRIVSMQSNKGGVGKTMLSLLLASYLRSQNETCRVVVFDLDFSGTAVVDLKNNSSDGKLDGWPSGIPRPRPPWDEGTNTLLDLFAGYLGGRELAELVPEKALRMIRKYECRDIFHIPSGKIFGKDADPLYGNILFDANHALWFVDFLFQLFIHIELYTRLEPDSKGASGDTAPQVGGPLHVILDNAPGQSELLPLLQRRMLCWGRHRSKFIHVASLDEMDIRASLNLLSQLMKRSKRILRTKQALAMVRDGGDSDMWGRLLRRFEKGKLDRDMFEEVLAEGEAAIRAVVDNGREETSACRYAALLVNRVFGTVDPNRVDEFILEQAERVGVKGEELPRDYFPFDRALALFFQERFLEMRPERDLLAPWRGATGPLGAERTPEAAPRTTAGSRATVEDLALQDVQVYKALYRRRHMSERGGLKRILMRGVGVEDVLHLMRGLELMGRLLDVCHRILVECRPSFPVVPTVAGTFHALAMAVLEAELEEQTAEEQPPDGRRLTEALGSSQLINQLLGDRPPPSAQQHFVGDNTIQDLRSVGSTSTEHNCPPQLQQVLDLVFPLYGIFVAYPDYLESSWQRAVQPTEEMNDNIHETRLAQDTLKMEYRKFFKHLYETACLVLNSATLLDDTATLCSQLESYMTTLGAVERHNVHLFHLRLTDVLSLTRFYDNSLVHGIAASDMLLDLVSRLEQVSTPMPSMFVGLTLLYIHTVLAELFHGLRADPATVFIEMQSLLGMETVSLTSPRLTLDADIEWRLGRLYENLLRSEVPCAAH